MGPQGKKQNCADYLPVSGKRQGSETIQTFYEIKPHNVKAFLALPRI